MIILKVFFVGRKKLRHAEEKRSVGEKPNAHKFLKRIWFSKGRNPNGNYYLFQHLVSKRKETQMATINIWFSKGRNPKWQ